MPELQDIFRLQAFVTVVDEGSLSAAVSKLHITQPALSARLKLLEESLGCVLLERTGRGVRPTPLGKMVYSIAVDILARMKHLQTTIQHHLELREGWIHLGGGATAVSGVFPRAIANFRKSHPNVQFTLHEQDSNAVKEAVRDGAIDVGIVTGHTENIEDGAAELHGLTVHGSIVDTLVVIGSNQHPLIAMSRALERVGKSLLPMHLNKQSMILFDEGSAIRTIIDTELRNCYIQPRVVMTLRSAQSMVRMVQSGIGLSVVSKLSLLPSEPDVAEIAVAGLKMQRSLLVITASERTLTPAAAHFLTYLHVPTAPGLVTLPLPGE